MRKKITLALLSLLLVPLGMMAQNVTVNPDNGSMMPALKAGRTDTFYGWGGFATWKHEQLSLTITTGDSDNNLMDDSNQLTSSGQLAKPANNIFESADGTCLQIGKGRVSVVNGETVGLDCYITMALPKGYRFTGYTIRFHRISKPDGKTTSDSSDPVFNWTGNINFGETDKTFTYTNASGTYQGGIGQSNTTKYTLTRTSDTDMGNVLYFKLDNGRQHNETYNPYTGRLTSASGRAFIQIDHLELYFTAEHNTPSLVPAQTANGVSAVDIPFTTGKIDYGQLIMRDLEGDAQGSSNYDENTARMSYDGTIRDMNANMILYEKGSVETVSDNGFDDTTGDMVKYYTSGHSISSAGDYFKLESSKHPLYNDDNEAIYYIESPIWATNSAAATAHKNPIGYRIVSAKINYEAGSSDVYIPATFKIQYESTNHGPNENGTYGLNVFSRTYNWNQSYHTVWRIDQDGYIYGYGEGGIYYLAVGGTNNNPTISMTTTKPTAANGTFEINNGQIRLKRQINGNYYYIGWKEIKDGTYIDDNGQTNDKVTRYFVITTGASGNANSTTRIGISTYNQVSASSTGGFGNYTLKIYEPDGVGVAKTINVTNQGGSEPVTGYNNDAIKIGVIGGTALINAEITMQALDPYIDRLDIVCQENGGNNGGRVTQTFNATDFSVKGGPFTFYVPTTFQGNAKFTFENLYSDYGDETYYDNTKSTNHARYFFVKSPYEKTAANVYSRNNETDYTDKVYTDQRGDKKFTFNNASTVGSRGGYFEEYAFTPSIYTKSTAQGGTGGIFSTLTFSSSSPDEMTGNTEKTAYLFTCDEPRYNIAPTTATQHVYYAFYEMKIKLNKKDYRPNLDWEKIYENESSFEGNGKTDSKWGVIVTTESVTDDHGTHSGYVTVSQLLDVIQNGLPAVGTQGQTGYKPAVQGLDPANTVAPKSKDQILYIDARNLMNIVDQPTASTNEDGETEYTSQLPSLKQNLGQNALIYLPYGSKPIVDNFAYNTIYDYSKDPIFRAANDIVLTDKYAFYAPYDIQVGAENSAKYTRQITKSTYKDEAYATVIMPFEIELKNGKHVDDYGTLEFLQMNTTNATSDKYYNYGPTVFFSNPNTNVEKGNTEANTPYALHATQSGVENGVFIVDQPGAKIVATPAAAKSGNSLFSATTITSTGNLTDKDGKSSEYTFSHKGSFSGYKIPKDNPKTFYFANNGFYSSAELNKNYSTVDLLPFRSVYEVLSGGSAKVGFLRFVEGENETSGIDVFKATSAEVDMNAPVYDLQGRMVAPSYREAKGLQNGLYVVNGVKIIVK
jgi:hypothetical protein